MEFINQLSKSKNKRYLILSAGGPQSGIQGVYVSVEGASWSILSNALLPYPSMVQSVLETVIFSPQSPLTLDTIGRLDHALSHLFLECAKTVCAAAQNSLQQPQAIVLNKIGIWKEARNESQARYWNMELGDAQLLSSYFKTPVVTDFARHGILGGGPGDLPLFPGICAIHVDKGGIAAHLTIGMISRLFIFDTHARHPVIDSDIGPGTCLINRAAREALCPDGFDRDGSFAAHGKVDARCLETLATQEWFNTPLPRQATVQNMTKLYDCPCLGRLAPGDKLTTLTALTARAAFDLYKKEYRHVIAPETMWISGGGANNLTLFEFLKTYFAPVTVQRIDDIGIPAEMFVPLALGLTVDASIMGKGGPWKSGSAPEIEGIGTWVFP